MPPVESSPRNALVTDGAVPATAWSYLTHGDGIDALQPAERPVRTPGPHDVVVRMSAVSLNYRDLLVINGVESWKPTGPRIPISDGVGIVVARGADVTHVREGDRVAGIFLPRWIRGELTVDTYVSALGGPGEDGVLTAYRVFDHESLVTVPAHLDDAEAATLPVAALTAWHAVRYRSNVQRGDTVLIQGTGGVSLFALQFAHARGAETIVISSGDEKLEHARHLGATHLINYTTTPDWEDAVLSLTHQRGVDHVIEVVGGANLNRSLRAVRVSGTISFIGLLAGLTAPISTYQFVTKNVRIHGIETGSREMFEEMNEFIAQHRLRPVIDRVYQLSQIRDALRHVESGGHVGKVAVTL